METLETLSIVFLFPDGWAAARHWHGRPDEAGGWFLIGAWGCSFPCLKSKTWGTQSARTTSTLLVSHIFEWPSEHGVLSEKPVRLYARGAGALHACER